MALRILTFLFYILFIFTPLIWTPFNHELFEYNKMTFVYLLTILIAAIWIIRMIQQKKLILKRTPLDLPLLLFLGANILSTIFSIDRHISIWGYYSRSNGGLLSIISYFILYFALVSNFTTTQALKFLKSALIGGLIVSLWAIPEHFGGSLSCLLIIGQLSTNCWVQDVQARVFATLGQPNWLAAYLSMLIFPALYFALTLKNKFYLILTFLFYLAFTFTFSRGATLGLLTGLVVFLLPLYLPYLSYIPILPAKLFSQGNFLVDQVTRKNLLKILAGFIIINLIFGSALTSFKLFAKFAPPPRPSLVSASSTQLESGGTESGQIRLIVWQGAWEIFKHYPLFGSGVETFAYTYYNFRPLAHNLVSEWDFLYNKAHNEYLNYLATTGLIGFGAYLFLIFTFTIWTIKKIVQQLLKIKNTKLDPSVLILCAILASYLSYLVQNFFGFSVVIIALFFFLFPALLFIITESTFEFVLPKKLHPLLKIAAFLYKRSLYPKILIGVVLIFAFICAFTVIKYWVADTLYAEGEKEGESGNAGEAYNLLARASLLNPQEPLYKSELGFLAASVAIALEDEDATLSAQMKEQADLQTTVILKQYPLNISYFRTAIRTYYMLSEVDKSYTQKALEMMDQTIKLAPTDPKLVYNKAIILSQEDRFKEAIIELNYAIKLKPNYHDAYMTLGTLYYTKGDTNQAVELMKTALQYFPNDPEVLEKLAAWQKKI